MINSYKPDGQIKVSLQEAVAYCKKYGGAFYQDKTAAKFIIDEYQNIVSSSAKFKFELNAYDFDKIWIYEPSKESAFTKWRKTMPDYNLDSGRKEGWNAAIDAVLKMESWGERNSELYEEIMIKELKEV